MTGASMTLPSAEIHAVRPNWVPDAPSGSWIVWLAAKVPATREKIMISPRASVASGAPVTSVDPSPDSAMRAPAPSDLVNGWMLWLSAYRPTVAPSAGPAAANTAPAATPSATAMRAVDERILATAPIVDTCLQPASDGRRTGDPGQHPMAQPDVKDL